MFSTRTAARPIAVRPTMCAPVESKMLFPPVSPWVKQTSNLTCLRINTGKVTRLMEITIVTAIISAPPN